MLAEFNYQYYSRYFSFNSRIALKVRRYAARSSDWDIWNLYKYYWATRSNL